MCCCLIELRLCPSHTVGRFVRLRNFRKAWTHKLFLYVKIANSILERRLSSDAMCKLYRKVQECEFHELAALLNEDFCDTLC